MTGEPGETPDGLIAAADADMYLRKPGTRHTDESRRS